MALPQLNTTQHELTLPDCGAVIKYRAMLVGEEKIMMISRSTEQPNAMVTGLNAVLHNCSFGTAPKKMSMIDFEYFFLHLIMVSNGEISDVQIECKECSHKNDVQIDLRKFDITENPHPSKIMMDGEVGVKMKSPDISIFKLSETTDDDMTKNLEMIKSCVEYVFDGEDMMFLKDFSKAEINDFFDSLTKHQMKSITNYIENIETIKYIGDYTCMNPQCKHVNHYNIEGINNFFS